MKENKNYTNFHIPSPKATVFEFEVNRKDDQRCIINVIRDEAFFYRLENGEERRVLIGDYKKLMEHLFKTGGCWLVRKKGKKRTTPRVFFEKSDASFLLREGYSVFHLQSSSIMSYDNDYSNIIVSNNEIKSIGEIPGGDYCVAWLEGQKPMTMKEVEAARQRAMEDEEAEGERSIKLKKENSELRSENNSLKTENKALKKEERTKSEELSRLKAAQQNETNEPEGLFSWKDLGWFGAASAFIFGGLGLGIGLCISKK